MVSTSIASNLKKIQPVVWILIFLLLPLQRYVTIPFRSEMIWNITSLFFGIALALLYIYEWQRKSLSKPAIHTALVISLVLIANFILGDTALDAWQASTQLLLVIWSAPVLYSFIRYNRTLSIYIVVAALAIQALWGITQFSLQNDLGLTFLGETNIVVGQPGIATFTGIDEVKVARSYGPYPHPNALAGSMVIGLIILTYEFSLTKRRLSRLVFITGYFLGLAVITSFSRAAWISLFILFLVACLTHTEKIQKTIFLITILIFTPFFLARSPYINEVAVTERVAGTSYALTLLQQLPLWHGVGPGNYPQLIAEHFRSNGISYESWQIAPVHAAPLLVLIEWGVIPVILLTSLLVYQYARGYRRTWPLLLPIIPLLGFDHYLLTQAAPLLYLLVVLILLYEQPGVSEQKYANVDALPINPRPPAPQ